MKQKIILATAILLIAVTFAAIGFSIGLYTKDDSEKSSLQQTETESTSSVPASQEKEDVPVASGTGIVEEKKEEQGQPQMPTLPEDWAEMLDGTNWQDYLNSNADLNALLNGNTDLQDYLNGNFDWSGLLENGDFSQFFPSEVPTPTPEPSEEPTLDFDFNFDDVEFDPAFDYEAFFEEFDWSKYSQEYEKYLEEWKNQFENGEFPVPDQEIILPESNFVYDEMTGDYSYSVSYEEYLFVVNGNLLVSEENFSFSIYTVTVNGEETEVDFTLTKEMIEKYIAELTTELVAKLEQLCPSTPIQEIE